MTFNDFISFSNHLQEHAGVENTLRRMGDRIVLKINGVEFFFDREGHYKGRGGEHHSKLADLVESVDMTGTGEFTAIDSAAPESDDDAD